MTSTGTQIAGATALVTGGNRGLGRAIVQELLDRGAAKVYATSRSPFTFDDERVVTLVVDVTDDASVAAAAEVAGDVSILVNNAGIYGNTPVLTAPFEEIQSELDTNFYGILRVTRAFAPILAENESSSVLNILSALSWLAFGTGYDASKSAAWSVTNSLRLALRDQGTNVIGLHVGYMDTDMVAEVEAEKSDPRDIARVGVDGILTGAHEILADDTSRWVKSQLSGEVGDLYSQLAAA
jgi:NAD(P)-dependent dehydrogenase (short-subunit alcohol dehydrogenase family)